MKRLLVTVVCMCFAVSAYARLGWTKAQMEEKFGIPEIWGLEHTYKIDENSRLTALYEGDKVVLIQYMKSKTDDSVETRTTITKEKDVVIANSTASRASTSIDIPYGDEEIKAILETIFPGTKWMMNPNALPTGDTLIVIDQNYTGSKKIVEYRRMDGLVYAYQSDFPSPKLVIFQPAKKSVIVQLKRQQQKFESDKALKEDTSKIKSKF